jgi:hypothetical protein
MVRVFAASSTVPVPIAALAISARSPLINFMAHESSKRYTPPGVH